VGCNDEDTPNVQSVSLVDFGLKGDVPGLLGKLPKIEVLDLAYNELYGDLPLGALKTLRELVLNNNDITGDEFGAEDSWNGSALEKLNLAKTKMSGLLPSDIGGNLEKLFAFGNELIGTLPQQYFSDESSLIELDLSENQLVGPISPIAQDSLTDLNLSGNILIGKVVLDSTKIASLVLDGNRLTSVEPIEASALTSLSLEGNQIGGSIPVALGDLAALTSLKLADNKFAGTMPEELVALTDLSTFTFEDNNLVGSLPDGFCEDPPFSWDLLSGDCKEVTCDCCTLCCEEGECTAS